jgi:hypothetical protein
VQLRDDLMTWPTGHFELNIFRRGRLIEEVRERNLIVGGASGVLASLVGGTVTSNSITQIGFGTNGAAAALSNTALTGPFLKAVDSVTYPAAGQVAFAFSLGSTQANGTAIFEFGLLTAAGTLFARKVRSAAFAKDTDFSLSGVWTLQF